MTERSLRPLEEYLALEEASPVRHELVGERLNLPRPGGTLGLWWIYEGAA